MTLSSKKVLTSSQTASKYKNDQLLLVVFVFGWQGFERRSEASRGREHLAESERSDRLCLVTRDRIPVSQLVKRSLFLNKLFYTRPGRWNFCYTSDMKLYLSSNNIPDPEVFSKFVGKPLSEIRLGLILNAKDYKSSEERESKRKKINAFFTRLGMQVTDIDLRDYYNNGGVSSALKGYDVLWFNGGNTYMLRKAIERSGCEESLKELLKKGVVYGGDSAGAIIAGPTIRYFDVADDPVVADEVNWNGLNLIDFVVLPHWGSEKYDASLRYAQKHLEDDGFKTVEICDAQYLLIEDGKILRQ